MYCCSSCLILRPQLRQLGCSINEVIPYVTIERLISLPQSLCKNLERADTKRWLTETLETLMKERSGEEKKEEGKKLEVRPIFEFAALSQFREVRVKMTFA